MTTDSQGRILGYTFLAGGFPNLRRALLWHFAMMLGLCAVIAVVVSLLTDSWPNMWTYLPSNLEISYCIGLSIFIVTATARLTFMRRVRARKATQLAIYFGLVAAGALVGNELAHLLIHRVPGGFNFDSGHGGVTAVVLSFIAAAAGVDLTARRAALAQHKRELERAERMAMEAQLRALQAQIEPHFLFNTLANLDALITIDAARARHLLANLIHYLRAALKHARSDVATLKTEMELLKAYLAIMALRLPNRLTTQFDCDPDCLRLGFPAMLVQPLVENAITHGIEPAPEGGSISVSVRRSSDTLMISVDDTGIGLGNAVSAGTGAGIKNVRARLHTLFGGAAQLKLEPRDPHGTHASIEVPLKLLTEVGG
jgi:signal transduction histidine kinase